MAAVLGLALGGATSAAAEPGLAGKVYSPFIERGVTEFELRGGRLNGGRLDGEQAAIIEVEHGFGDRLSLSALAEVEQHAGESSKIEALAVEGRAYLGKIPWLGVDVGGYLEYEQRLHAESGVIEGKLLLAKRSGAFEGLLNLSAGKALTDKSGEDATEFGYAAEASWEVAHDFRLGLQAFGDLGTDEKFGGRQAHLAGPVARWEFNSHWLRGAEIEVEGAYLLPLGAARDQSDGQIRFVLAYERKF